MSRLKPSEVAVALERVRTHHPAEAERLAGHIEAIGTEDALLSVVREMIEAKEQSKAAEEVTAKILDAWKPIMEVGSMAIGKMATEEKRANDLKQRELDRQDRLDVQGLEVTRLRYKHIIVPAVTALAGFLAAWSAFNFAG